MARGDFPSSKQDQYMVRFPDGMRDRIKEAARQSERSMNAEIVTRLDSSFAPNAVGIPMHLWERMAIAAKHHGMTVQELVWDHLFQLYPEPTEIGVILFEEKFEDLAMQLPPNARAILDQAVKTALREAAGANGRWVDADQDPQQKLNDRSHYSPGTDNE